MKKTYLYFLFPLAGMIAFGAVYWNFNEGYEAREREKARLIKEAKNEKIRQDAKNREKAIKDALEAQEQRRKERAAKEAKEEADKKAREAAIEARNKANADQQKFGRAVERLEKEIKVEEAAIAKILEDHKKLVDEESFLKIYVKQAQSNAESLAKVLDKIADADRKAAEAAAAAAKAAKN